MAVKCLAGIETTRNKERLLIQEGSIPQWRGEQHGTPPWSRGQHMKCWFLPFGLPLGCWFCRH